MKGRNLRLVATTATARRRWQHLDPVEIEALVEGSLDAESAKALRRHLAGCLNCSLLVGRLAGAKGIDLERLE